MSNPKIWLTEIHDVRAHPNADALDLALVQGWQMAVKKGAFRNGDPVIYFEQGLVLPPDTAESLGVTNYLANKTDIDGNRVGVIHRVKLRGEPSFGLVLPATPGTDLLGLTQGVVKFNPPALNLAGGTMYSHPLFPNYTEVENLRSYPNILREGEMVCVTEKVDGTSCKLATILNEGGEYERFAGSRQWQRIKPERLEDHVYWFPHTLPSVQSLFAELEAKGHKQVVLYGEVYGPGIRTQYGVKQKTFRAFDLMIDGRFVDSYDFQNLMFDFSILTVPLEYIGPYSFDKIKELSESPSVVGGGKGREGVVVKPLIERNDPTIGRVALKYVADSYLFSKAGQQQDTTDL